MSVQKPALINVEYTDYDDNEIVRVRLIEKLKSLGLYSEDLVFCGIHTRRKLENILMKPEPEEPIILRSVHARRR